ncbi:MAG: ATP-binding cassette domain-containing protein [Acidimicrobiales bacterium]
MRSQQSRISTLALKPGAITGFLGPSGAGKTTTLPMTLGLVAPRS